VTHVQLLPVQDLRTTRRARIIIGLRHQRYNTPEGWYATGHHTTTAESASLKLLIAALP